MRKKIEIINKIAYAEGSRGIKIASWFANSFVYVSSGSRRAYLHNMVFAEISRITLTTSWSLTVNVERVGWLGRADIIPGLAGDRVSVEVSRNPRQHQFRRVVSCDDLVVSKETKCREKQKIDMTADVIKFYKSRSKQNRIVY